MAIDLAKGGSKDKGTCLGQPRPKSKTGFPNHKTIIPPNFRFLWMNA